MWIRTLDLGVGKCSRLLLFFAFLFRNREMTIWISSMRFVQLLVISMPLGWWKHGDPPQHFPVLIPYLPRTKPVFSCIFEFWIKPRVAKIRNYITRKKPAINPWEPVNKYGFWGVWRVGCHHWVFRPTDSLCANKFHEKTGRLLIVKRTRKYTIQVVRYAQKIHCLSEDSRRRKVVGHEFEKCRNSFPTRSLARHGTRHW